MDKQRIFVSVVGFSDVERHALNTVFRLSEERDLSYAPWVPLIAPGAEASPEANRIADVALVDGESAEAVLSHAKELPPGQRLIWVGPGGPAHAWRVLQRPIQWASVLNDLDAVFAARQADSGYLDLDISAPVPLDVDLDEPSPPAKRALLVGTDLQERTYLRSRLALARVTEADEVSSTETAVALLRRNRYSCGVFNLDEHQLDVWALARLFAQKNPQALLMGISEHAGPRATWWSRRRVMRDTRRAGIKALLARPLQPRELSQWMELL